MPEELSFDLDSAMELATESSMPVEYEQLFNQASMSTSDYVCSAIMLVWSIICMWRMFQKAGLPGW